MNGRIAFAAGIAIVGLELLSIGLWARAGFRTPGYVFMTGPFPMLALLVSGTAQAAAGLILVTRRPENRVGWVILGFATMVALALATMAATALDPDGSRSGVLRWIAWLGSWLIFPGVSLLAFWLAFIFPTGRLPAPRWRAGVAAVAICCLGSAALLAFRPGPLLFFPLIVSPLAFGGLTGPFTPSGTAALAYSAAPLLLLAGSSVVAGTAMFARYRAASGFEQVQVRWYIASGVILAAAFTAEVIALLLLHPRDPLGEAIVTLAHLWLGVPPVAMTFAILRYRLYDIDTIISKTFVFGVLTAVLAGMYAASIRLFNAIFTTVTGDTSELALVITTLLLATTFTPIKSRLERVAGRRLRPEAAAGGSSASAQPGVDVAALIDDPAVVAAIDRRIEAALAQRSPVRRSRRRGPDPADASAIPDG